MISAASLALLPCRQPLTRWLAKVIGRHPVLAKVTGRHPADRSKQATAAAQGRSQGRTVQQSAPQRCSLLRTGTAWQPP